MDGGLCCMSGFIAFSFFVIGVGAGGGKWLG